MLTFQDQQLLDHYCQTFKFHEQPSFLINDQNRRSLAMDEALLTNPNSAIPVEMTAYLDTKVIEILTAPKNSTEILNRVQKGDWTTPYAIFTVIEHAGKVEPYADFSNAGTSDINPTFPHRPQVIIQTNIRVGDREIAVAGKARLNLVSHKQGAAANAILETNNKINLLGIDGLPIYGLLNEPNLPAPIASTGNWNTLDIIAIYDLITQTLFGELATNTLGRVTQKDRIVLAVSPSVNVLLGKTSTYDRPLLKLLDGFFSNLEIVVLPELEGAPGSRQVFMVADDVGGIPTGEYGYSIDYMTFPLVREPSSYIQKVASSNYGCILYYPMFVAHMTGV